MELAKYKACICSYALPILNFSNSGILVEAIKEYHRTAKIPKGEYTLLDLLK